MKKRFFRSGLCRVALAAVVACVAAPAGAAFLAAELIYVPAVAHNDGAEGSHWRTDLFITNVDEVPIDVALFFAPSSTPTNFQYFQDRSFGVGGRENQGFGHVEASLADIPPGGTVTLEDVVGQFWLDQFDTLSKLGGIVVFVYEAGTLDSETGPVYRNGEVLSRTYSAQKIWTPDPENEGSFIEQDATFGQVVPGVPWYNLADSGAVDAEKDLSYVLLIGGREDATYRYNVGVMNTSDFQTSISLRIEPFKANGEAYTNDEGVALALTVVMGPLSHIQYNQILSDVFQLEDQRDVLLRISIASWNSTSTDPVPTFTAYGTVIDNRTNDATTILPSFGFPYDVECIWGSNQAPAAASAPRSGAVDGTTARRPPLGVPPR